MEDARLLLDRFGKKGRELLLQKMDRLENHAREWVNWKLEGLSVETAIAELYEAKVISQRPDDLLEQMKAAKRDDDDRPFDPTEPAALTRALVQAGIVTMFDTETGFVPCHHEELLSDFASNSAGKFNLESPIQIWRQQDEADYDGPYLVHFIYRKRLYSFEAENYGDYYDVASVVRALNTALELNRQAQRYIGLYTGDQCACFVFADPNVFLPIARKYSLPLSEDASEGMRAGRAYEEQVFDSEDWDVDD
jgi:hypothetical protein